MGNCPEFVKKKNACEKCWVAESCEVIGTDSHYKEELRKINSGFYKPKQSDNK